MTVWEPARELAEARGIPLALRILLACLDRCDRRGRAVFGPGELEQAVNLPKDCRTHLNATLRRMAEWGVIAPEPSSRVIVLSPVISGGR